MAQLIGSLAARERQALTQIAEAADLLMVDERPWLLVPASPWLIDTLAALNAECEDREPCMEDEPSYDDGTDYREPSKPPGDWCKPVRVMSPDGVVGILRPVR